MTDIVERLRSPEVFIDTGGMTSPVARQAADEIERLRAALREIVEAWDWWQQDTSDRCQSVPGEAIARARAALGEPAHG